MINRQNFLGKTPEELGVKDAIHTPIVSVRAGEVLKPGQGCKINENRDAIPGDEGIVDPFRKDKIMPGQHFWMLMDARKIDVVRHEWDSDIDFTPPTTDTVRCKSLEKYAEDLNVSYDFLMESLNKVYETRKPIAFPGELPPDFAWTNYDIWSEWSDFTATEFPNFGTYCCPEYEYPDLFE